MAGYHYKRVVYRDDFAGAAKRWAVAVNDGKEWEGVDMDGDAWRVVAWLLDEKDVRIAALVSALRELVDAQDDHVTKFPAFSDGRQKRMAPLWVEARKALGR